MLAFCGYDWKLLLGFAVTINEGCACVAFRALNRFALSKTLADPENKYTLLAPTDEAFKKLAVALDTPLDELLDDEDIMPGILENHILSVVYEGPDLLAERSLDLKTKNGSTISLETNSQGTLIDLFAKGSSAKVIDTDIDQACESAVHTISNVLLPFSLESEGTGVRGRYTKKSGTCCCKVFTYWSSRIRALGHFRANKHHQIQNLETSLFKE